MYEGSMVGAGCHVFAVWGYVIAKGHYDTETVELNPRLLAFILGSTEIEIFKAIDFLCAPDVTSRSKVEEGRKLIRKGEFLYFIPNLKYYRDLFDEEARREYMKIYMRNKRSHVELDVNTSVNKLTSVSNVKQGEGEVKGEGESKSLCRAIDVLNYLNEKTGKKFQPVNGSLKFIDARMKEGATMQQCCAVIDMKCDSWLKDDKMNAFLRPQTLFNAEKFAAYVGEINKTTPKKEFNHSWDIKK